MFKQFTGFNLVEQMHKLRQKNRFNPSLLKKKSLGLIFVAIIVLVLWFLPTESFGIDGLTAVQQRIIAIFVYATLMWVLELVPAWATSVSIMVFLLLCASDSGIKWICNPETAGQLLSYKQVMASFADPVVMLFIGGFVLAIATTKTGLDVHLARVLLTPFGKKSENILLGFMLVTALFSMFISNTATTAMMLTFLTPVFRQLPEAGKGRTAMALSIPIAANLGGMGTPIGTPPNTIALKYLNDPEGLNLGIGFGQWMLFMVPLVIVMIIIAWMLLKKFFPFTQKTIELQIDGEMKKGKETTLVIVTMIVTILLWMMDTVTGINTYTVALIPFAVFAMVGIITKYDLEEINWSVIWMVAGGFALGYAMNGSGLAALVVLCDRGPADAHPGCRLYGHGRQAGGRRRHLHRPDRRRHRLQQRHDPAHLHTAECARLRHQHDPAEGHGPDGCHHRRHQHRAGLPGAFRSRFTAYRVIS